MPEAKIRFVAGDVLEVDGAMRFYLEYILGPVEDKEDIRREYGFSGGALVSPNDWELFAAILIRQRKSTERYGHDLAGAEVKSAKLGGGFEYQYHLKTGEQKLENDPLVDHVFIVYSEDYLDVTVVVVPGHTLRDKFDAWKPQLQANYASRRDDLDGAGKQRFRRSINHATVVERGQVILEIRNGQLQHSSLEPLLTILPGRSQAG
jgi:hypothetical protein